MHKYVQMYNQTYFHPNISWAKVNMTDITENLMGKTGWHWKYVRLLLITSLLLTGQYCSNVINNMMTRLKGQYSVLDS